MKSNLVLLKLKVLACFRQKSSMESKLHHTMQDMCLEPVCIMSNMVVFQQSTPEIITHMLIDIWELPLLPDLNPIF